MNEYYWEAKSGSQIASFSPEAASGNPLRGLIGGARYAPPETFPETIDSSMEFYNIGLEVMFGENTFDWSDIEELLDDTASRNRHSVLSFFIHWPGRPLRLPAYLLSKVELRDYPGGVSPYYGDTVLLDALRQFITEFGSRYDGDKRIGFIHLGLLGFWGKSVALQKELRIITSLMS
jgi:hypothetical protein